MKQMTAMQMQESATLKAGHGIRVGQVQIEEQKVDDVTVEETIGEVAKDAGHEQAKRDASPGIARFAAQKQDGHNNERDTGERDKKAVVVAEGAEGRAGVGDMDESKETGDENVRVGRIDKLQDQTLRQLVECVERQGEVEKNFHRVPRFIAGQRPRRSGRTVPGARRLCRQSADDASIAHTFC